MALGNDGIRPDALELRIRFACGAIARVSRRSGWARLPWRPFRRSARVLRRRRWPGRRSARSLLRRPVLGIVATHVAVLGWRSVCSALSSLVCVPRGESAPPRSERKVATSKERCAPMPRRCRFLTNPGSTWKHRGAAPPRPWRSGATVGQRRSCDDTQKPQNYLLGGGAATSRGSQRRSPPIRRSTSSGLRSWYSGGNGEGDGTRNRWDSIAPARRGRTSRVVPVSSHAGTTGEGYEGTGRRRGRP